MCVVSNVADWGRKQWPQPWTPVHPTGPWPSDTPTRDQWAEFRDLIEKAKEIDIATNQPDCDTEEKTAWMQQMEKRIQELEEALKKNSTSDRREGWGGVLRNRPKKQSS